MFIFTSLPDSLITGNNNQELINILNQHITFLERMNILVIAFSTLVVAFLTVAAIINFCSYRKYVKKLNHAIKIFNARFTVMKNVKEISASHRRKLNNDEFNEMLQRTLEIIESNENSKDSFIHEQAMILFSFLREIISPEKDQQKYLLDEFSRNDIVRIKKNTKDKNIRKECTMLLKNLS